MMLPCLGNNRYLWHQSVNIRQTAVTGCFYRHINAKRAGLLAWDPALSVFDLCVSADSSSLFHHHLSTVNDVQTRLQLRRRLLHRRVAEQHYAVHRADCDACVAVGEYRLQSTYYRRRAVNLNIVSRHCLGQTLPTGERVALLLGIRFESKSSAVEHVRLLVADAVKSVGEKIGRECELGRKRNLLLADDNRTWVVSNAVRPLHEVMTLGRSSGDIKRGALSQASARLADRSVLASRQRNVANPTADIRLSRAANAAAIFFFSDLSNSRNKQCFLLQCHLWELREP